MRALIFRHVQGMEGAQEKRKAPWCDHNIACCFCRKGRAMTSASPHLPEQGTEKKHETDDASGFFFNDAPREAPELSMGPLEQVMLQAIQFYQKHISPKTPPSCRFQPTCSEYARRAILRYGWHKGAWLTCCRLGRCHPLHPGGIDPVP